MPEKCHLQTGGSWLNFQIIEAKYKVADIKGIVLAAFLTRKFKLWRFPFSRSHASTTEPMVHTTRVNFWLWTSNCLFTLLLWCLIDKSNLSYPKQIPQSSTCKLPPASVFPVSGTSDSILPADWAQKLEVIADSLFLSYSVYHVW